MLFVGGTEFNLAVEFTASALDEEQYEAYEYALEYFDDMFYYDDHATRMNSSKFEDCVTEYRMYGSHDIG